MSCGRKRLAALLFCLGKHHLSDLQSLQIPPWCSAWLASQAKCSTKAALAERMERTRSAWRWRSRRGAAATSPHIARCLLRRCKPSSVKPCCVTKCSNLPASHFHPFRIGGLPGKQISHASQHASTFLCVGRRRWYNDSSFVRRPMYCLLYLDAREAAVGYEVLDRLQHDPSVKQLVLAHCSESGSSVFCELCQCATRVQTCTWPRSTALASKKQLTVSCNQPDVPVYLFIKKTDQLSKKLADVTVFVYREQGLTGLC